MYFEFDFLQLCIILIKKIILPGCFDEERRCPYLVWNISNDIGGSPEALALDCDSLNWPQFKKLEYGIFVLNISH